MPPAPFTVIARREAPWRSRAAPPSSTPRARHRRLDRHASLAMTVKGTMTEAEMSTLVPGEGT